MALFGWDWGNVPSWASTGTFLIAGSVYLRDRNQKKRQSIEDVSIWGIAKVSAEESYDGGFQIDANISIKNGGSHPVYLGILNYVIHYEWRKGVNGRSWSSVDPGATRQSDTSAGWGGEIIIPGDTKTGPGLGTVINRSDPDYYPSLTGHGLGLEITEVLLADHTGRRWRVTPFKGERPKRFRWYRFYWSLRKKPDTFHPWHTPRSKKFNAWVISRQQKAEQKFESKHLRPPRA